MPHSESREFHMIDNPDQVEHLLQRLQNVLPLPAFGSPSLIASLREGSSTTKITPSCTVTRIDYAGDEGGIMCHLVFDEEAGPGQVVVSITHLAFDPRLPGAREIAAYQKHRIKRLRRNQALGPGAQYH
jgi:hypothetical protein